jgi:AcrR family transcriptional regulator
MSRKLIVTDDIRVEMLTDRASGMTLQEIADKHGVTGATVCRHLGDIQGKIAAMAPVVRETIENLQILLGDRMRIALDQLTEAKAADINFLQLTTALDTLNRMRRLESGQATSAQEVKYTRVDLSAHKIIETQAIQAVSDSTTELMRITTHTADSDANEAPKDIE